MGKKLLLVAASLAFLWILTSFWPGNREAVVNLVYSHSTNRLGMWFDVFIATNTGTRSAAINGALTEMSQSDQPGWRLMLSAGSYAKLYVRHPDGEEFKTNYSVTISYNDARFTDMLPRTTLKWLLRKNVIKQQPIDYYKSTGAEVPNGSIP